MTAVTAAVVGGRCGREPFGTRTTKLIVPPAHRARRRVSNTTRDCYGYNHRHRYYYYRDRRRTENGFVTTAARATIGPIERMTCGAEVWCADDGRFLAPGSGFAFETSRRQSDSDQPPGPKRFVTRFRSLQRPSDACILRWTARRKWKNSSRVPTGGRC